MMGTHVLTRMMKRIEQPSRRPEEEGSEPDAQRNKRVIAIGYALRQKGLEGELKRKREYRRITAADATDA